MTDDKLDRVRVMADKLARVRAAARELESALRERPADLALQAVLGTEEPRWIQMI